MKIKGIFKKITNGDTEALKKVNGAFIDESFNRISKEIESLRKYDRGEKEIYAPDVGSIVRNIRKPA